MSSVGIVTFDNPCYLISGLGNEFFVYVGIIRLGGPDEWILLSTTRFTRIDGLCNAIEVVPAILPPPKGQFYGPVSRVVVPSDGWGIVQTDFKGESLTVSMSDDGNDISIPFVHITPPADFVDPAQGLTAPSATPPEAKVHVNGGSIWNGIEDSQLNFYYTVAGGDVVPSPVIPFGQGSGILTNATISTFIIRQPATGPPKAYWAVSNVEEYEGVSAVVMQKILGPPTGNELGTQKYLASMIGEGILTTNLTDVL